MRIFAATTAPRARATRTRSAPAARRSSRCCATISRRSSSAAIPTEIEAIWKALFFHTHATAVGAITSLALAAIDTALWDLRCRRSGLPLCNRGGRRAAPRCRSTRPKAAGCTSHRETLVERRVAGEGGGFRRRQDQGRAPARSGGRGAAGRGARGGRRRLRDHGRREPGLHRRRGDPPRPARSSRSTSPGSRSRCRPRTSAATSSSPRTHACPIAVGESLYSLAHFREYLAARRLHHRAGRRARASAASRRGSRSRTSPRRSTWPSARIS